MIKTAPVYVRNLKSRITIRLGKKKIIVENEDSTEGILCEGHRDIKVIDGEWLIEE